MLVQTTKYLSVSKARPGPTSGSHQPGPLLLGVIVPGGVGAPGEGVADEDGVVAGGVQRPVRLVGDLTGPSRAPTSMRKGSDPRTPSSSGGRRGASRSWEQATVSQIPALAEGPQRGAREEPRPNRPSVAIGGRSPDVARPEGCHGDLVARALGPSPPPFSVKPPRLRASVLKTTVPVQGKAPPGAPRVPVTLSTTTVRRRGETAACAGRALPRPQICCC
jgi:hypothetical protein